PTLISLKKIEGLCVNLPRTRIILVLLQVAAEALDAPAGLLDLARGHRIGHAERWPHPEGRALHHRNTFGRQQLGDEVLVALELFAGWRRAPDRFRAGWIDVERPLRLRATQPLSLVEHGDAQVTPFLEDTVVLRNEILWPVERRDRSPLRRGVGVGGRLRLQRRHCLDQMLRSTRITDAPAGHAISFRHAIE